MSIEIRCGAQIRSDDDVLNGKGEQCGELAYFRCLDYRNKNVYRCFKHGQIFSKRVPINREGKDDL